MWFMRHECRSLCLTVLLATASFCLPAQERRVSIERVKTFDIPVGEPSGVFWMKSRVAASLRGGGLVLWDYVPETRKLSPPITVPTLGDVRSVFTLGDQSYLLTQFGITAFGLSEGEPSGGTEVLPMPDIRFVSPCGDDRLIVCRGELASLYRIEGTQFTLVRQWTSARFVKLEPKQDPPPITHAVLTEGALLLNVHGRGLLRLRLDAELEVTSSIPFVNFGAVTDLRPLKGTVLLASSRGLLLLPLPASAADIAPDLGPGLDEDEDEDVDLEEGTEKKKRPEVIKIHDGPVGKLHLSSEWCAFTSGKKTYTYPFPTLIALAELLAGQSHPLEDGDVDAEDPPKPRILSGFPEGGLTAAARAAPLLVRGTSGEVSVYPVKPGEASAVKGASASLVPAGGQIAFDGETVFLAQGKGIVRFSPKAKQGDESPKPFASGIDLLRVWDGCLLVAEGGRIHSRRLPDLEEGATWQHPEGTLVRCWAFLKDQLLAADESGARLFLLSRETLEVQKDIRLKDAFRVLKVAASEDLITLFGAEETKAPKPGKSFSCLLLSTADFGAWQGDTPRSGPMPLGGRFGAFSPVVSGRTAWLLSASGYRDYAYALSPGATKPQHIDLMGGVSDVAVARGLAFCARGLYGITAHDLRDDSPLTFRGGVSHSPTQYWRLAAGPDGSLAALHTGGLSTFRWKEESRPPLAYEVSGKPASLEKAVLMDGGADVTSHEYANLRGYAAPLKLRFSAAEDLVAEPTNGTVIADPTTGEVRFPGRIARPVRLVSVCTLPHAFGAMALLNRDTLLVGGNEGMNLEGWDLSRPKETSLLWRVEPSVGPPRKILIRGKTVYTITNIWSGGLYIYDLSDPRKPKRIGGMGGPGERRSDMELIGDLAVIRIYDPGATVAVVDVSRPDKMSVTDQIELPLYAKKSKPVKKAMEKLFETPEDEEVKEGNDTGLVRPEVNVELQETSAPEMASSGNHVFVPSRWEDAASGRQFWAVFVYEVKDAKLQGPVATYEPSMPVAGAATANGRLYLSGVVREAGDDERPGRARLEVLDISRPAEPNRIDEWTSDAPATSVGAPRVLGTKLWLGVSGRLVCLDVEGTQPKVVTSLPIDAYRPSVLVTPDRLFVQDARLGVTITDITDLAAPKAIGQVFAADGWGGNIDVSEGYAYVGSEGGNIDQYQLQILDVREPERPRLANLVCPLKTPSSPSVIEGRLWMSSSRGPNVFDLSGDPLADREPQLIENVRGGIIQGRAFRSFQGRILCGTGGKLSLLKQNDDGKFAVEGQFDPQGQTLSVACDRRRAYWLGVVAEAGGATVTLRVLDYENLRSPQCIASLGFPGWHRAGSVEHRDGHLFIWLERHGGWTHPGYWAGTGSHGWLYVISVEDPAAPRIVTRYPAPAIIDSLGEMRLHGELLYFVSYMGHRLCVTDVSRPSQPVIMTSWRNPAPFYYPGDIDLDGDYGYFTTPYSVEILKVPLGAQKPLGQLRWE